MNREQILNKHLGSVYLSDTTRQLVLDAMREVESFSFEFINNIDWERLAKQKKSLAEVIAYLKTKPKEDKLKNDIFINILTGILDLIDNLQDNNCKE